MRRIILSICIIGSCSMYAQNGPPDAYNIKIQAKPFHDQLVYLGHYFGGRIHLVDSVLLNDRSEANFKASVKLPEGIYAMFSPDKAFMFDVLIDTLQHFSISADLSDPRKVMVQFKNSPSNILLDQYEHHMMLWGQATQAAQQKLRSINNKMDSLLWVQKLLMIDDSIRNFREAAIKKDPGSVLSRLFIAMRDVNVPASLMASKNAIDSAAAKQFISDHYWDGVNFWDGSLTYSPFFEDKLDNYFNKVLPKNEDTVIKKIDRMMSFAGASEIMTQFLLQRLLYGSMNHRYTWGNEVYVHLFEKYVAPKTYTWLLEEERKLITERAYVLMGKTVGAPAPDINLPALDGKNISVYAVNSKYTILCFWDPLCSHCRLTLPRMDSVYIKKWKTAGVKIFSIGSETDGTKDDWTKFITDHNLQDWVNVYCSGEENKKRYAAGLKDYTQLYEILYYPSFFVLDKDKNFIAKRLKYEQIVDLMESLMKMKAE